ncbi:MAG: hypothetical protein KTR25_10270 [Myxococcales bacterium]|nr:hypothetical protein [Myxococcales bacterium]
MPLPCEEFPEPTAMEQGQQVLKRMARQCAVWRESGGDVSFVRAQVAFTHGANSSHPPEVAQRLKESAAVLRFLMNQMPDFAQSLLTEAAQIDRITEDVRNGPFRPLRVPSDDEDPRLR